MKSYDIIAYAYNAALHCPDCTLKYYSANHLKHLEGRKDEDGNVITPVFSSNDLPEESCCDDCCINLAPKFS